MKYTEIKAKRTELLELQNNRCLLCEQPIDTNEAVLDHNHTTGHIRGVLHRGCNALLGHIENNQVRNRVDNNRLIAICRNLISYKQLQQPDIHPTFVTKQKRKKRKK